MSRNTLTCLVSALVLSLAGSALAQNPAAPAWSSNPGATYTVYLNFSGFDYSGVVGASGVQGAWGFGDSKPGVVHAYDTDGDSSTFSADEINSINQTWAILAQTYVGFNINVTTVDPYANAGNYAARQAAYDAAPHFVHTSIGGDYDWFGGAGGVSYVGTAQYGNNFSGAHTNWVFGNGTGNYAPYMATAGSHEDGHALGLNHQTDESNGNGYSDGDYDGTNWRANGTYGPTMGVGYYTQRGTWRVGNAAEGNANDVAVLQSNEEIGDLRDDGIGHSFSTATSLAVAADGTVDVASDARKGFIMPLKSTGYVADQYTEDFFAFASSGGLVTLTANDGTDWLQAGVADPGATMRSTLQIFDANGNLVGTASESADTLSHSFTGVLAAGTYYAKVGSYGAYISSQEPNSRYFNMGAYFITGSGLQPVPEPGTMIALGIGAATLLRRRKKA